MHKRCIIYVVVLLMAGFHQISAQELVIDTSFNISHNAGNDVEPSWSPDGRRILYQSDRNSNWDVFMYDLELDTTFRITDDTMDEQNPGWYPNSNAVYFDKGEEKNRFLYKLDLEKDTLTSLFSRKIICKGATFTPDGRMMYFLGFDEQEKKWTLFSYHFVYDVLNNLSDTGKNVLFFDLSADAKKVVYGYETYPYPFKRLRIINWYGEVLNEFDDYNISDAGWYPGGLKMVFISDKDSLSGELYSIWNDQSHLQRLTNDAWQIRDVAMAPDGSAMACSVLVDGNYEIIIILFPQF